MNATRPEILQTAAILLAGMLSGEQGTRFYQGQKPLEETKAQVKEAVTIANMLADEVLKH